jgi:hypothetical protein
VPLRFGIVTNWLRNPQGGGLNRRSRPAAKILLKAIYGLRFVGAGLKPAPTGDINGLAE